MDFCKKKSCENAYDSQEQHGRKWIWTSIDTPTRLIINYFIGDRTLEDGRKFLTDLSSRMERKPLFVSDELPHYADGLKELYHQLTEQQKTGKPGRPQKAQKVVLEDLDYATVHKVRENGRVVKIEKRVVYGDKDRIATRLQDLPSNTINTSFVERSNLNWRLWDAHLTRKCLTFAKSFEWLQAKFSICVSFYNFIRPHETLSRQEDKSFVPKTPAMAAGITDRVWTISDLMNVKSTCQ